MATRPQILLVEDNIADAYILQELFRNAGAAIDFQRVVDGAQALDYLFQRDPFQGVTRPDCVFLDLNLPKKSGHEVLAEIRGSTRLKNLPVIVISTSENPQDRRLSVELGAQYFFSKPRDLEGFEKLVQSLITQELPDLQIRF